MQIATVRAGEKKLMHIRIGRRVLITMLAVAVPSLLLFSLLVISSRGAVLRQNIIRQLEGLSNLSVAAVADMVTDSKNVLLTIAASRDVENLLRQLHSGKREGLERAVGRLEQTFLGFQQLDKTIQAIRFIDTEGYVMAKVREGVVIAREGPVIPTLGIKAVSSKANRDFFKKAVGLKKGDIWVSNLERGWMEGEEYWCPAMVRFATPVFFANGERAGVVVINVWGEALGRMINRLIPPEEGSAFLIEKNANDPERHGIYLFHPNRTCEFGNQTGSRITVFQDYPQAVTSAWMGEEAGISDHPQSKDILIHRFFSPYKEKGRGWVVVISARRDVFMAPLAVMKKRVFLFAGLVLALTVTAAFFFSRTITTPIRAVIDGTQRISRDLSSRIRLSSRDEIGVLAKHINRMAETLERNLEEKRRVEEHICQSEKLASIGEMAAGLAHELNTPLSNIRALAVLSQKDVAGGAGDQAAVLSDLGDIIGQTEKCSRIISGLLSFARKQKSEFALHSINALLENALALVRIPAEKNKVRIDFQKNDHLPHIKVDGHQIEQVCVNILLNALDAVDSGGMITVRTHFRGRSVAIRFQDNGPGINPAVLPKIFDPFFTTKGVGRGTGLGLSLSYGIVKSHGGTIEVDSIEGEGTVFTVVLPVDEKEKHEA